jgi:hypothetical protein
MRSNVLLNSGEHYNRRQSNFYKRIRDSKELSIEQKLRLTKNHTQNIAKMYVNNIMSHNPGVGFSPRREEDLHDQKMTELTDKLWRDGFQKYTVQDKLDDWCDDFVVVGEVGVKIFYDPDAGDVVGYNHVIDDESGEPVMNEFQQFIPDMKNPIMEGRFIFEEVYGFNLLRPSECKDLRQAEWLCLRKMANKSDLKLKYKDDPDKQKYIVTSSDETYLIFDGSRGAYRKTKNQLMLREYYFRPSQQYPHGYFFITTREGIIEQGELPGGIFPIIVAPFERIQTTPRGRSAIKQIRPYQAEINRSASKMAEHQITLGDDKLLLQNGTKVSAGVSLPGVRSVNYTGIKPEVLPGRSGEQYVNYMESQIDELYKVMGVQYSTEEDTPNMDPYILMYRAASKKVKFQRYIKRFEAFYVEVVKTYLRLAKIHMTDDALIKAWGEDERANIGEWRSSDDICYNINVEAQADDIETKFGKQMTLNHALQYVGGQMTRDDIGKVMREMPYANAEGAFDDFTLDYDIALDDILALDRGEQPPIGEFDNHPYLIKKLTARMRKRDFKYLSPQVQASYNAKLQMHQQFESAKQIQIQRAEQGFIPTSGYSVTCQMYVNDPSDPSGQKTRLVRVPYDALAWLVQHLQNQGSGQAEVQGMNEGNQAQIAGLMTQGQPPMGGMPGGAPGGHPGANAGGRQPLLSHSIGGMVNPPRFGGMQPGAAMPTRGM